MTLIIKIFKDIFTGIDGKTYHFAKFSWAGSLLAMWSAMVHTAYLGQPIDFANAGIGISSVCAAHAAAIYGMKSQEPTNDLRS